VWLLELGVIRNVNVPMSWNFDGGAKSEEWREGLHPKTIGCSALVAVGGGSLLGTV